MLGQIAFDELGRLVTALSQRELGFAQSTIQPRRLTVAEHKLAVLVHQVGKRLHVVFQNFGQIALAIGLHQFGGGFRANGRQCRDGLDDPLVHRALGAVLLLAA